ncbi:MAG TPA: sugar phosphate isomerase/epimerase family protein [Anaerolineales bacterium]|nr:sugar phosphate isomerase/epimerase family protein [Anaerolineales bacterium]
MNPITFSTLACPNWSIHTIIAKAAEFGYDGVEWRGGPEGHVQPTMPSSEKTALRTMSTDAGLKALAVTAYTSFVSHLIEERQSNVDELRRYAYLAAELGADYVRAFLGELPEGTDLTPSIYQNILESLNAASEYAISVGVRIAVEPHDNFTRSAVVSPLFDRDQSHLDLRVIWDLGNTFAAGEDTYDGFRLLKDHLAYVQVKDGIRRDSGWQLCPVGQGNVLLAQAFTLLLENGYEGAFSVEWEYAWHPELAPPEKALPEALQVVRSLLAEIHASQATK